MTTAAGNGTPLTVFGTISLRGLIDALAKRDLEEEVRFDFGYFQPCPKPMSYRGYYDHLAIGYAEDLEPRVTVAALLDALREADGKTYEGYKGGKFRMDLDTPVWAANYSECPSTAIVGIDPDARHITILQTAYRP